MVNLIFLISISVFLKLAFGQTCEELNCPICCLQGPEGAYCSSDTLTCQLTSNTDFNMLLKTILYIAAFIVGIPILLFILDILVVKRIACLKMSICELLINGLCLCKCLRRTKQYKKPNKNIKPILQAKTVSKSSETVVEMFN